MRKFWNFFWKFNWKIEFIMIFRKLVTKNSAFGNSTILLQEFFRLRGVDPPPPRSHLNPPMVMVPCWIFAVSAFIENYSIMLCLPFLSTISWTTCSRCHISARQMAAMMSENAYQKSTGCDSVEPTDGGLLKLIA